MPLLAKLRKQMRQMPNLRYTARDRPQSLQRYTVRELNLGLLFAFSLLAFGAIRFVGSWQLVGGAERHAEFP